MNQGLPEFRIQAFRTVWVNEGRSTVDKWITILAAPTSEAAFIHASRERAYVKKRYPIRVQRLVNGRYRTVE